MMIFVPASQLKSFQEIQVRLVRELENTLSGKHLVFMAQRKILPMPAGKEPDKE